MMRGPSRLLTLFIAQRRDLVVRAMHVTRDAGAAEDVVQDAWLRLSDATSRDDIAEPVGYLRRIVRNLALDECRRRDRRTRVMPDAHEDMEQIAASTADAERALIAVQELAAVTAELVAMPQSMRIAVTLHRLSGATLREVADELGVSVTTAHKLVTDGVERCRRCLAKAAN